ncbi:hypothetical protein BJF83_04715 [Nocardiopsis sp. CNR-923]|nr:hypothetical protein BJF83_04715 [Nocardiopsis sp. CNR-923]
MEQPLKDYVSDLVDENIEFEYIEDLDQGFMQSHGELRDHANLQIIDVLLGMDLVSAEELQEEGVLIEDANGNLRLPTTTAEWESGASGHMSAIERLISESELEDKERVEAFVTTFIENYSPNLYEGRVDE